MQLNKVYVIAVIIVAIIHDHIIGFNCEIVQSIECMSPQCYCLNGNTLHCNNFTSFEQLNFLLTNGRYFDVVELRPLNVMLDLDEKLKFNGLRMGGRLSLSSIRSFNILYNPFKQIAYHVLIVGIFNSQFRLVGGPSSLINECIYDSTVDSLQLIFSETRFVELSLCNVFFEDTICPLIFRSAIIDNLNVIDPLGAYGFKKINYQSNYGPINLNSNIYQLDICFSDANQQQPQWIDAISIINPDMFTKLNRLNINSARRLAYIQEDTFKYLPNLKKLELNNVQFKSLITRNRRWLKNLNYFEPSYDIDKLTIDNSFSARVFQLIIWVDDQWLFNDERDVCLFRNFPHNKLVFPFLLYSNTSLPCTCTIYWLYRYLPKYQNLYNLNQDIMPYHCFNKTNWDGQCKFDQIFSRWCPDSDVEPDESFTTLRPSVEFVTGIPTQTAPTASTSRPPTTSWTSSWTTSFSSSFTSLSTYPWMSSALPIQNSPCNSELTRANLFLAIALCIVAAFIVAALVVLYYLVLHKDYSSNPNTNTTTSTAVNDQSFYDTTNTNNYYSNINNLTNNEDEYI
jgi:hypothetical protein